MLASGNRMRRSADFAATMRRGARAGRSFLVVYLWFEGSGQRCGLVVSKAVGGAVDRNLVKRRLRVLLCQRLGGLPEGLDLVVRALPGAAQASFQRLSQQLDGALADAVQRCGLVLA